MAPLGLYYAPDPSSQKTSTIGGNIAENAGGPHCLSHGMTTNHVVGLELVTRDGLLCTPGGQAPDAPGLRSRRAGGRLRGNVRDRDAGLGQAA